MQKKRDREMTWWLGVIAILAEGRDSSPSTLEWRSTAVPRLYTKFLRMQKAGKMAQQIKVPVGKPEFELKDGKN